ncbi:hypothetical protein ACTRXD_13775 [Nitrospira sp. T9]|uniref:hypothetical protein n=1 Tax=unclassified Nitrospira TaxID=2652172 RepID=UPI003F9A140D
MEKSSPVSLTKMAFHEKGFRGVLGLYVRGFIRRIDGLTDRLFDRAHGIETSGKFFLSSLDLIGSNPEQSEGFESTPVLEWRQIIDPLFQALPKDLSDFVFVDFGSGKGKALFLASYYNFKKIIGVEFARDLHEVARRNISNYKASGQRCFAIEAMCIDALKFEVPTDKCVFFFSNPFKYELFSMVLQKLLESYESQPRKMYFIYSNPICKEVFECQERLKELDRHWYKKRYFLPTIRGVRVYESK